MITLLTDPRRKERYCSLDSIFGGGDGGGGGSSTTTTQTNTQATSVQVQTTLTSGPVTIAPKVDVVAPIALAPSITLGLGGDFLKPVADTFGPIGQALQKALDTLGSTAQASTQTTRDAINLVSTFAGASLATIANSAQQVNTANQAATQDVTAQQASAAQLNADLRRLVTYPTQINPAPQTPTIAGIPQQEVAVLAVVLIVAIIVTRALSVRRG